MMENYLPQSASIAEACAWLQAETGEQWTLQRMIERSLMPWFWVDYDPASPDICGDNAQGYQAPICFNQDLHRLVYDGSHAVVTLTKTHDGKFFQISPPGWKVALADLRFKREDVAALAVGPVLSVIVGARETTHKEPSDGDTKAIRCGSNPAPVYRAWIALQAKALVKTGDTLQTLGERIYDSAKERNYRNESTDPIALGTIIKWIPKGTTGGLGKNGRKPAKMIRPAKSN